MTKSKKVQVGNWGTAEGTNTFAWLINCKQTNNPKFKRKNTELAEADSGWPYLEVSSANKRLWRSWTERWRKDPGTQCLCNADIFWKQLTDWWLKWHAGVDWGARTQRWLIIIIGTEGAVKIAPPRDFQSILPILPLIAFRATSVSDCIILLLLESNKRQEGGNWGTACRRDDTDVPRRIGTGVDRRTQVASSLLFLLLHPHSHTHKWGGIITAVMVENPSKCLKKFFPSSFLLLTVAYHYIPLPPLIYVCVCTTVSLKRCQSYFWLWGTSPLPCFPYQDSPSNTCQGNRMILSVSPSVYSFHSNLKLRLASIREVIEKYLLFY